MPHNKVVILTDNKTQNDAVGMLVNWVQVETGCEVAVVRVDVGRWFIEAVRGVRWLYMGEIKAAGLGGAQSALAVSIEHIRQMAMTPLSKLIRDIRKGCVSQYGKFCGLCWHHGRNDSSTDLTDRWEACVSNCVLNNDCRGSCCEEWQRMTAVINLAEIGCWGAGTGRRNLEQEYSEAVAALFKKLVLGQLDGAKVLLLVGEDWETVYKLRTSKYVVSVVGDVYVCGVSLSDVEKPITELPNFTMHAPGPDFKDGLIYDIKEEIDGKAKSKC